MDLHIEATRITPYIAYNPSGSILHLKGRSSPENPIGFYTPVYEFLESFEKSSEKKLVVNVALEYFNTSSTKVLFNIFRTMSMVQEKAGKKIVLNWFYEEDDEDMLEIGEDFSDSLDIEVNLKEISEADADSAAEAA